MNDTLNIASRRTLLLAAAGALSGCKFGSQSLAGAPQCRPSGVAGAGLLIDVLHDRTTAMTREVAAHFIEDLATSIQPGDRVRITRFGGRQAQLLSVPIEIVVDGKADPWRDSPNTLRRAKTCEQQSRAALRHALANAFADYDGSPRGHSPIFEALAAVAEARSRGDGRRLCVLASDGVQHSAAASFIASRGGGIAVPAPAELEARLRAAGLLPAGAPASVVHVGFGSGDGSAESRTARSAADIACLRRAWAEGYWKPVGVASLAFGLPLPVGRLDLARAGTVS